MARLTTLRPRLVARNINRVAVLGAMTHQVQRKRGSAGVADRNRIRERDCGLCQQCKENGQIAVGTVVDHKVPLWAGGTDDDSNKWLICDPCHAVKTAAEATQRARGG